MVYNLCYLWNVQEWTTVYRVTYITYIIAMFVAMILFRVYKIILVYAVVIDVVSLTSVKTQSLHFWEKLYPNCYL